MLQDGEKVQRITATSPFPLHARFNTSQSRRNDRRQRASRVLRNTIVYFLSPITIRHCKNNERLALRVELKNIHLFVPAPFSFIREYWTIKCNEQCKSFVCKSCKMLYDLKAQDFILFIFFYYFFFILTWRILYNKEWKRVIKLS